MTCLIVVLLDRVSRFLLQLVISPLTSKMTTTEELIRILEGEDECEFESDDLNLNIQ